MKKITIKVNFITICQFDKWLEVALGYQATSELGYLEKCATSLLTHWRVKKINPHTHFHTNTKINIKLETPVAMALIDLIQCYSLPVTDSLGIWLNKVSSEIDQQFQ